MTVPILTRAAVRQIDQLAIDEYGMTGLQLMENAGRQVADVLCGLGIGGRVVICCGKGNNAGDGIVIARHLDLRGFEVRVLLMSEASELRGDALVNYEIIRRAELPLFGFEQDFDEEKLRAELSSAAWIVDALLGTGSIGPPRPPLDRAIRAINAAGRPVLAIDLPSGLDADTGEAAEPTIRAAHTCTFVAAKPGLVRAAAAEYVGQLHVLDIGAPRKLIEQMLAREGEAPAEIDPTQLSRSERRQWAS